MNEEEAINKIRLLKTVRPAKPVLQEVRDRVYQRIGIDNKTQYHDTWEWFVDLFGRIETYRIAFSGAVFALLVVLFLTASVLLPQQMHIALLYSRLAFPSNHYQKARVALSDTKNRFEGNKLTQTNMQDLSDELALTNTTLSRLKLKGEKGKYTSQECQQLYREYLMFLKKEERAIPANSPSFTQLRSQVNTYEEQAEKKLQMYPSL